MLMAWAFAWQNSYKNIPKPDGPAGTAYYCVKLTDHVFSLKGLASHADVSYILSSHQPVANLNLAYIVVRVKMDLVRNNLAN